jgi:hypothetical protein
MVGLICCCGTSWLSVRCEGSKPCEGAQQKTSPIFSAHLLKGHCNPVKLCMKINSQATLSCSRKHSVQNKAKPHVLAKQMHSQQLNMPNVNNNKMTQQQNLLFNGMQN